MIVTTKSAESLLLDARDQLAGLLPRRWSVVAESADSQGLVVSSPSGATQRLQVDPYLRPTPGNLSSMYRIEPTTPVLVVAPYLSPRSREVLENAGVYFLDLTGNAWIYLDDPGLALRTEGAQRDPTPRARPDRGISGRAAGRVVRALADVSPPYSVTDLAALADVSPGYCSRTLQALEREALVIRDRRGTVISVDWPAMLRRRGQVVPLFDARRTTAWIARAGTDRALDMLASLDPATYAVTGSFAAARVRAIAAPAGLAIYTASPDGLAATLDLLPADAGADVRLITPTRAGEMDRTRNEDGIEWVALSQLAIDCFGGPGRMAQEGDAVLAWMADNEDVWRLPHDGGAT